jgi:endonuclease/exonuclease/phosphatase (EEP) superfamily protein YafD
MTIKHFASLSYALIVVGAWMLLRDGDRWVVATAFTYGPRWVLLMPALPLALLGVGATRFGALVLTVTTLLVAGPVMAFNVPGRLGTADDRTVGAAVKTASINLKIVSINLDSGEYDHAQLDTLLRQEEPDILLAQECDLASGDRLRLYFPHVREGRGLCAAAREPISPPRLAERLHPVRDDVAAAEYVIEAAGQRLRVANLHLDTPRPELELVVRDGWRAAPAADEALALRERESAMVRQWLSSDVEIVAGDFNQTVDGALYQRDWAAYRNAFSEVALGFGHTKFTTWFGARIDHVLTAPRVEPLTCRVASDIGSDHRPVVAVVRIPPSPSLQ